MPARKISVFASPRVCVCGRKISEYVAQHPAWRAHYLQAVRMNETVRRFGGSKEGVCAPYVVYRGSWSGKVCLGVAVKK